MAVETVRAGRPRGSRNPNTKARREAVKQVIQQFQIDHPNAFPGDAVSLMQCIYRDVALFRWKFVLMPRLRLHASNGPHSPR